MSLMLMTRLYYEFIYDNLCVGFHTTEFLPWFSPGYGVKLGFVRKLVFYISNSVRNFALASTIQALKLYFILGCFSD